MKIPGSLIYRWQDQYEKGELTDSLDIQSKPERRIIELETLLGRLMADNELLKKVLNQLSTRRKRDLLRKHRDHFGSIKRGCRMLNFPLSTFYYKPKEPDRNNEIQEADIKDQLEKIICGFPGYGSRLVTAQLKREGWIINRKRIQRIMRENELLCVVKRKKNWMNYS